MLSDISVQTHRVRDAHTHASRARICDSYLPVYNPIGTLTLHYRRPRREVKTNTLEIENYHTTGQDTLPKDKSQDGGGVGFGKCVRVFSDNRQTARGSIFPIHAPGIIESQYGGGIPPPGCVRVGLQVGSVQYNTTQ